jgi:LytS/YehU family sensor histidine kinase
MALYVLAVAIAFAWFLVRDWNGQEKQLRELRALQTGTELNFLKLQINPHFLFNTLNNLFSVAQKNNDEETAGGIAKLADLMRYLLNESSKALIPLEQELHYIHSYIELAKMRFSNDELDVVFDVQGAVQNHFVPPMLLIPFIENAFKHGVRVGECSRIVFKLNLSDKRLDFSGNNPDHAAANYSETRHHGIGLENVRKRISLLYPADSEMTYGSENGIFQFHLRLPV